MLLSLILSLQLNLGLLGFHSTNVPECGKNANIVFLIPNIIFPLLIASFNSHKAISLII